jgi:hypothetical protein
LNNRLLFKQRVVAAVDRGNGPAADLSLQVLGPPQNHAFGRYIASLQKRDPFTESGPVLISIEASLPKLYKEAKLLAVRELGGNERSQYCLLQIEGDGAEVMLNWSPDKDAFDRRPCGCGVRHEALNGCPYARFTHLGFAIPPLGRGEMVIKEYLLSPDNDLSRPGAEGSQ